MLKNILLVVLVLVGLAVTLASFFWAEDAVSRSGAQHWPGARGALDAVAARFPPLAANEASRRFTTLANALPANDAADEFVRREIARGELAIGEAPVLSEVTSLRDLLLREPVVWERREAFDDIEVGTRRVLLLKTARALVANALSRARASDPRAWEDLRAVWTLARTQDGHPQMMAQTAAMTMERMVNAVAWKLPLPAPDWLDALSAHDPVAPLLDAFQYQTAYYWENGSRLFPTKWLAQSIDRDREIAEDLSKSTCCDLEAQVNEHGPALTSIWRRAFRYRAEREATVNALRAREGNPIETKSACSDGSWSLDGTTLRFNREIPLAPEELPMPLTLHVDR